MLNLHDINNTHSESARVRRRVPNCQKGVSEVQRSPVAHLCSSCDNTSSSKHKIIHVYFAVQKELVYREVYILELDTPISTLRWLL